MPKTPKKLSFGDRLTLACMSIPASQLFDEYEPMLVQHRTEESLEKAFNARWPEAHKRGFGSG